jgi:hypothetical protein
MSFCLCRTKFCGAASSLPPQQSVKDIAARNVSGISVCLAPILVVHLLGHYRFNQCVGSVCERTL